jgi:hypothetical protein
MTEKRRAEARTESKCISLDGSGRKPARLDLSGKAQKAYREFGESITGGISSHRCRRPTHSELCK